MRRLQWLLITAPAVCVGLVIILSLLPASDMVRTSAPGPVEHAMAYFGTAGLLALNLRRALHYAYAAAGLIALAGTLELCQGLVSGRHPRWVDFLGSSSGVVLGLATGALALQVAARTFRLGANP